MPVSAGLRAAGFIQLVVPPACAWGGAERVAVLESDLRKFFAATRAPSIRPDGRVRLYRLLILHPVTHI
jgi:hypothetical protein